MDVLYMQTMLVQTKFLRLFQPVALGDRIEGWRVCWLGGWDKGHVCFGPGKGHRLANILHIIRTDAVPKTSIKS